MTVTVSTSKLSCIVGTDRNAILVNDYANQIYNFAVKVVFLHSNSQFAYLMTTIHPEDSLDLFISKHAQIESVNKSTDFLNSVDSNNLFSDTAWVVDNVFDNRKEPVKKKQYKRLAQDEKGKKIADQPLQSALRSYNPVTNII
ncbi:12751_t:CDS:2 [Gigaspora rosea]|nr:12751_t:CDS:2 [Gigaspora rosea]